MEKETPKNQNKQAKTAIFEQFKLNYAFLHNNLLQKIIVAQTIHR